MSQDKKRVRPVAVLVVGLSAGLMLGLAPGSALAADPVDLKEFKKGPRSFNKWRKAKRKVTVDLSGARLSGQSKLFEGADLNRANLNGADLSGVVLDGTDLKRASLQGANLSGGELNSANLRQADLTNANLSKAMIWGTSNFSRAVLMRANLQGAKICRCTKLQGAYFDRDTQWPTGFNARAMRAIRVKGSCNVAGKMSRTYDFTANAKMDAKTKTNVVQFTEKLDLQKGYVYTGRYIGATAKDQSVFEVTSCVQKQQRDPKLTIAQTNGGYKATYTATRSEDRFTGKWQDNKKNKGDLQMTLSR